MVPRRPVRRAVVGLFVERVVDDRGDRAVGQPRRPSPALRDPPDAIDTFYFEPSTPGPYRIVGGVAPTGHFVGANPVGRQQQGFGLDHLAVSHRRRAGDHRQLASLLLGHRQRRRSHSDHIATVAIGAISATDH